MFTKNELSKHLYFDIETVAIHPTYSDLKLNSPKMAELWEVKSKKFKGHEEFEGLNDIEFLEESYKQKAALFPEFGKIVCISTGVINFNEDNHVIKVHSYYEYDENSLINKFFNLLIKYSEKNPNFKLSGFNILKFDIPFVSKRALINGITIPSLFNVYGKAPYQLNMYDLYTLWFFGGYESASLDLLATVLDIESPKDGFNFSNIHQHYHHTNQSSLKPIAEYCEGDVRTNILATLKISNIK